MNSQNALIFKFCPPLLLVMLLSIVMAQFSSTTNPDVLPIKLADSARVFGTMIFYIGIYAAAFIWAGKPKTPWGWICTLSAAAILPISTLMLPYSLAQTVAQSPLAFDLNVVPLDGDVGFQPSIEMGKLFVRFPSFAEASRFFYDHILVVIAIVATGEAYYGRRLGIGVIPTFLLMSSIGFAIYFALPVVGPAPFFGNAFPLMTGQISALAPRNCMPSLHTAYALIAFLSTRGANILFKLAVGGMSLLVATATLGLGEHYLTDLVLAFPLVTMFRAASSTKLPIISSERITAFIAPLFLLLVWGSLIRGDLTPPRITGFITVAMAATVACSLLLERRLAAAEGAGSPAPQQDMSLFDSAVAENAE